MCGPCNEFNHEFGWTVFCSLAVRSRIEKSARKQEYFFGDDKNIFFNSVDGFFSVCLKLQEKTEANRWGKGKETFIYIYIFMSVNIRLHFPASTGPTNAIKDFF